MSEDNARFLGNIYGFGRSFAGAVWDANHIAPTLTTMQGGGREPHIMEIKNLTREDKYECLSRAEQSRAEQSRAEQLLNPTGYKGRNDRVYATRNSRFGVSKQYNTQRTSTGTGADMSDSDNGEYP